MVKDADELQDVEKCLDITLFRPDRVSTKLWKQGEVGRSLELIFSIETNY